MALAAPEHRGEPHRLQALPGARDARHVVAEVQQLTLEVDRLGRALAERTHRPDSIALSELAAAQAEIRALDQALTRRLRLLEEAAPRGVTELRLEFESAVQGLSGRIQKIEQDVAAALSRLDAAGAESRAAEARLANAIEHEAAAGRQRTDRLASDVRATFALHGDHFAEEIRQTRRSGVLTAAATALLVLATAAAALAVIGVALEIKPPAASNSVVRLPLPLRPTLPAPLPEWTPPPEIPGPTVRGPVNRPPPPVQRPESLSELSAAILRGEPGALDRLQGQASAGAAGAQMLLAKLYEKGGGGLAKDAVQARRWTGRAAESGERAAMYNLGLYLMQGDGGPIDEIGAVRWFQKAAALGVVDAQYNLGLLYEAGRGAPKNLTEAYRWFSVAANAGDGLARAKAVTLEARLGATERAAIDRQVQGFAPGSNTPAAGAPVIPPATTVADSARFLARAGYYLGPTDGADTAAYREAVAAYLRDHPRTLAGG